MVINLIKDYNIKLVNNEEILYIYLDFNSEFANLSVKRNDKELKSEIKKYLSENNIVFKGVTVAIVVGGIMMGTLLFNKPETSKNYSSFSSETGNIVSIIDKVDNAAQLEVNEFNENNVENNVENVGNNVENVEKEKLTKEGVENKEVVKEEVNNKIKNNVQKQEVINKQEEVKKEELVEEKVEAESNLTYVTLYRINGNVLKIELEEYLIGVIGAEMPASFNIEALKAQAVVARTYTLRMLNSGKKIIDSSSIQNYKSNSELKALWGSSYNTYYKKIKNAVESTKGMYLTYNDEIIDAVYHSTSNGKTEDAVNVWGRSIPYLKSVDSIYDNLNKTYETVVFMSYDEVSIKLNNVVSSETNFNILKINDSGRVSEIEINGTIYSGVNFRNLLGLRSADFKIIKTDNGVNITTEGYGHGVGMSQYGANGMANNGYNFKNILFHYYNGCNLTLM